MGIVMLNGELYGGGGKSTTRFVSDTTDENYGWIQYKDENGEWVNWNYTLDTTLPLYMSSANEGGFYTYVGKPSSVTTEIDLEKPTVTFGGDIVVNHWCGSGQKGGCIVSQKVDLTDYDVWSFDCTIETGNLYAFITTGLGEYITTVAFNTISGSGTKTIDISKLSGEYHVGFFMHHYYPNWIKITLGNIYLE